MMRMSEPSFLSTLLMVALTGLSTAHASDADLHPEWREAALARRGALQLVSQPAVVGFFEEDGFVGGDLNVALELYKLLPIVNPYLMLGVRVDTERPPGPMFAFGLRPTYVMDGSMDWFLDVGWGFLPGEREGTWRMGAGIRVWTGASLALGPSFHYLSGPSPLEPVGLGIGMDISWNFGRRASSVPRRR